MRLRTVSTLIAGFFLTLSSNVTNANNSFTNRVFETQADGVVMEMTATEMTSTQGSFYCGGACILTIIGTGVSLYGAGLAAGDQIHEKWFM
jgi:hypothetical protein